MTITDNQLSPVRQAHILSKFLSDDTTPELSIPYKSDTHVIATNSHYALFLLNNVLNSNYTKEYTNIVDADSKLLKMYNTFIRKSTPSLIKIELNSKHLEEIIHALIRHQDEQNTKNTRTILTYSKEYDEVEFKTVPNYYKTQKKSLHYTRPAHVSSSVTDFSVMLNTSYLINSLETQKQTDKYTTLEIDPSGRYVYLSNNHSSIVIMQLKDKEYTL